MAGHLISLTSGLAVLAAQISTCTVLRSGPQSAREKICEPHRTKEDLANSQVSCAVDVLPNRSSGDRQPGESVYVSEMLCTMCHAHAQLMHTACRHDILKAAWSAPLHPQLHDGTDDRAVTSLALRPPPLGKPTDGQPAGGQGTLQSLLSDWASQLMAPSAKQVLIIR